MDTIPLETLLVAADDRTGALEVAGACAAAGAGPVTVVPLGATPGRPAGRPAGRVEVVDLGTRHLPAGAAAAAAAGVDRRPVTGSSAARIAMHKIDSTLRGNWAHEVVARRAALGGSVLVVPALPALGRSCVGGEVREHGRPVATTTGAIDPRTPLRSSRPADLLRAAGAGAVEEVTPGARLASWLAQREVDHAPRFAVCDASDDDDLARIAATWAARPGAVLLAGTSAAIAAGVSAVVPVADDRSSPLTASADDGRVPPGLALPWLVVAGSLHPASAAQVEQLSALGARTVVVAPAPGGGGLTPADAAEVAGAAASAVTAGTKVVVVRCARPDTAAVTAQAADAAAAALARAAALALEHPFRTLVVLGGDTAAAVLADRVIEVGGTVAPGMPWGRVGQGDPLGAPGADLVVVTKAGAFGDPGTLARLLRPTREDPR